MITLDAESMHAMHINMYMSDAQVCLVPFARSNSDPTHQEDHASARPETYRLPTAHRRRARQVRLQRHLLSTLGQFVEFGYMALPEVLGALELRSRKRRAVILTRYGDAPTRIVESLPSDGA